MLPANLMNLLAACILSLTTPSVTSLHIARDAADALRLLSRQNSQCPPGRSPCNNGTPANFCCPSNQHCIVFNSNKSAICCPTGQDCQKIAPLPCDLSKQNATTSPNSGIHSTDLTGTLAKCGSSGNCCPKGYACQNDNCVLQSEPSSTSKTSSTASSTSSPTHSSLTSSTSTSSASPTNTASPSTHGSGLSTGAKVGLVVAGIFIGIIIAIGCICCISRHNKKKAPEKSSASIFSSNGQPSISDPMPHYQQNGELRNDFLRRDPNLTSPEPGFRRNRASSRVRSLFSRSPTFNRNTNSNYGYGGQRSPDCIGRTLQTPMQTPPPKFRRESSGEIGMIYSPPNEGLGARDNVATPDSGRPGTTFSGMMRAANLEPGQPDLGTPGRLSRGVGE